MKTVLQELIKIIEDHRDYCKGNEKDDLRVRKAYSDIICALEDFNLLEKEKQQIINAYYSGFDNGREVSVGNDDEMIEAEDYFNNTYK